jgi:hypothetical protein
MSKILYLKAERFLNLAVVEVVPDGTAVWLKGKNEAGKSAVMDAVFAALTGKRPENCIKEGEDEARIEVKMDGYTVVRNIVKVGKNKTDIKLEVKNDEGMRLGSPQTFLNDLIGKLTFDPMEFAREHPLDQKNIVLKAVGVDFSDLETQKKTHTDNRADKARDLKKLEGALSTMKKPPKEFDGKTVTIKDMIDAVTTLKDKRAAFDEAVKAKKDAEYSKMSANAKIHELEEQIKAIQNQIVGYDTAINKPLPPAVSDAEIAEADKVLETAQERNNDAMLYQRYLDTEAEITTARADVEKVESQIKEVETERARRLKEAKLPVEGLGFDDDGLTFEGLPLARQSAGRSCEIYTAIAMALNPNLRVIFIRDASLLDKDMVASIMKLAQEKDYQVWLEKVEEKEGEKYPKIGLYLEAGGVVAIDGKEVLNNAEKDR